MFVDEKLIVTWQSAPVVQKVSCILGFAKGSVAVRLREGILPRWSAPPAVLCPALGPQCKEGLCKESREGPLNHRPGAPLLWT